MADTDIQALEAKAGSWAQTGKDLGSGAAGGIAQVLLGESDGEWSRWDFPNRRDKHVRAKGYKLELG